MGHNSGWKARWPSDWTVMWKSSLAMYIPGKAGIPKLIKLRDVIELQDSEADALITTESGRRFYVRFQHRLRHRAMDLPVLVHPVTDGAFRAFWILPGKM